MALDQSVIERNRASTDRIRALVTGVSDGELQLPVGEDWTVAITLAHLAFWDKRVINILENTARENKLVAPEIDIVVNDISLPFWAAIPPREAARMALEIAEALDERLASLPSALFEEIKARNERWVVRALHRNQHLDQIDAALKK